MLVVVKGASLVSMIVVTFIAGSAFGFYILPAMTSHLSTSPQTYVMAFTQEGAYSPTVWAAPWEVIINARTTRAAPANATLPIPDTSFSARPDYRNLSVIGFEVSNGVYTYSVSPKNFFHGGIVTINGADAVVTVHGPFIGCTTTIATSSTTS